MQKKNLITILGIGNILLQDEGFGPHFISWLSGRWDLPESVRAVDGGTLGYGLLDIICSCEHLIVIDVIKIDDAPGSLYRFTQQEMEARMPGATSAHEVTFMDVLTKAELIDEAPDTAFLCIVPQKYGTMNLEMTSCMKERFPDMEKLLLGALSSRNIHPARAARA